jgi:3D (Asp-Asp-Asp) domain-containing protein
MHKLAGNLTNPVVRSPPTVSARRTRSAALLACVCAVLVLTAGSTAATGRANREHTLRAQESVLALHAQSATLALFALDSRLGAARAKLATLRAEAARMREQLVQLEQQIAATRHMLVMSRRNLGANLRTLYERGNTDPLAVFLGAESLGEAVTTLDGLKRVTDQSSGFVRASLIAEQRLHELRSELSARRVRTAAAVRDAAATTRALTAARGERLSFLSRLRAQQQLKAAQIAALVTTVQRAEVKSQSLTATAAASGPVPAVVEDPSPAPVPAPSAAGHTLVVSTTGYSLPGHTSTGLPVGWGVVAVDPTVIPLGTRMTIPGYGEAVAADVGSGVRGAMIDLWFPTIVQAHAWGRRTVTITLQ